MNKTIIMLIGPKGSGKTTIGLILERHTNIRFLCVESIWLKLSMGQDGWEAVEYEIDVCLEEVDLLAIESLGGSEGFEKLRHNLEKKYILKYVRVIAPLDICLQRVRSRDSSNHLPISDEKVEEYNQLAAKVILPWDSEINNHPPMTEEMIVDQIARIQQRAERDTISRLPLA